MTLLGFDEFASKVRKALADYYGTEFCVTLNRTRKNNGLELTGVCVKKRGDSVAPTVYLEGFYRDYIKKGDIGVVVFDIIDVIARNSPPEDLDVSDYFDYAKIQENIEIKLINKEKNKLLLEDIPYVTFLDMAIVFHYVFDVNGFGNASILVRNEHLELWGIGLEQLYSDALVNTKRLRKPVITNLTSVVADILMKKGALEDEEFSEMLRFMPDEDLMYVISTSNNRYGAITMLYEDDMKAFADKVESDFFIIPSSVHELILVPIRCGYLPEMLHKMIKDVNDTQVAQDEILSYSLYMYSRAKGETSIIQTNAD